MADKHELDLETLTDSPHLLNLMIQFEDVLDSMDLYVFRHWLSGEIAEGPIVKRYWLDVILRYPKDKMPDPRGARRLLKHGVRVDYQKAKVGEDEEDAEDIWLVHISVPRRLLDQMDAAELDIYDEEIDADDVEDAMDDGMDDDATGYESDEDPFGAADPSQDGEENKPNA